MAQEKSQARAQAQAHVQARAQAQAKLDDKSVQRVEWEERRWRQSLDEADPRRYPRASDRTFCSTLKNPTLRYLSTFSEPENKSRIAVTRDLCEKYGLSVLVGEFRTIESIFQAFKFVYSAPDGAARSEHIKEFMADGKYGSAANPAVCKKAGSKKQMAAANFVLDEKAWSGGVSLQVMKMAVCARATVDVRYAKLLQTARTGGFTWLHWDPRAGKNSIWGGSFAKGAAADSSEWQGRNLLGSVMLDTTDPTAAKKDDATK